MLASEVDITHDNSMIVYFVAKSFVVDIMLRDVLGPIDRALLAEP